MKAKLPAVAVRNGRNMDDNRETVTLLADNEQIREYRAPIRLTLIRDLTHLLISLKREIGDEYRCSDDSDDSLPGMLVTIGADATGSWSYQTGDNSYTGGAYSFPHWALVYLYRRSNCTELAREAVAELGDMIAEEYDYHGN